MGWFDLRFQEDQRKVRIQCKHCDRPMWFPQSKAGKYVTCGGECAQQMRADAREQRMRPCETCGQIFLPRTTQLAIGHGRYCSQACNTTARQAINSPEAQAKAAESMRRLRAAGLINYPRGEKNHKWKGGREAFIERWFKSGVMAQRNKEYRAKNPEKLREWAQNRKNRKLDKLPRGTIPKIGALQRWRCAACRASIKGRYHADHIVPLAGGGHHEPNNIQLLCPKCNLHKSAKHPVDFMQSQGYLL